MCYPNNPMEGQKDLSWIKLESNLSCLPLVSRGESLVVCTSLKHPCTYPLHVYIDPLHVGTMKFALDMSLVFYIDILKIS